MRQGRIAVVSQEKRLTLCQQIADWRVQRIEIFIEPEGVKLFPPFLDDLGDRGPYAAPLVAQQSQ